MKKKKKKKKPDKGFEYRLPGKDSNQSMEPFPEAEPSEDRKGFEDMNQVKEKALSKLTHTVETKEWIEVEVSDK